MTSAARTAADGRWTVFVLDPVSDRVVQRLQARCQTVTWRSNKVGNWPAAADAVIVRTSAIGRESIARAVRLKVIGKHGSGTDNIDLDAAADRGIRVFSTPGINAASVAELTLALALVLARRIVAADRWLRCGEPGRNFPAGRELRGCGVGLIGFGHVARAVAELFRRALECQVSIFCPSRQAEVARSGFHCAVSLDQLLATSDILSLHVPLTPATEHLISARELRLMPPGSVLINTARGGIVDEQALLEGLRHGRPAAAACDVFAHEPLTANHPLLQLANFVATPHLGAATEEALDRVGHAVVDGVFEALSDWGSGRSGGCNSFERKTA